MSTTSRTKRLTLRAVKYLALEGGGGKGNVFIGAIKALEDLGLLSSDPRGPAARPANSTDRVLGFAGASAGAITAFFLSIGYTAHEIATIMGITDFNEFFDDTIWSKRFGPKMATTPYDYVKEALDDQEFSGETSLDPVVREMLEGLAASSGAVPALLVDEKREKMDAIVLGVFAALLELLEDTIEKDSKAIHRRIFGDDGESEELEETSSSPGGVAQALRGLAASLGIFPGLEVRWFLHKWLTLAVLKRLSIEHPYTPTPGSVEHIRAFAEDWEHTPWPDDRPGDFVFRNGTLIHAGAKIRAEIDQLTFAGHLDIFGRRLAVSGSNLQSFESQIFSADTTPEFSVVDAVRISMSLPFLYKPMIITADDLRDRQLVPKRELTGRSRKRRGGPPRPHWMQGIWVDGGLFNNLPIHVFDNLSRSGAARGTATLGLRLDAALSAPIRSIGELAGRYFQLLGGTGEAHLSATRGNVDRTIELDTHLNLTTPTRRGSRTERREITLLMFAVEDKDLLIALNRASYRRVLGYFGRGTSRMKRKEEELAGFLSGS